MASIWDSLPTIWRFFSAHQSVVDVDVVLGKANLVDLSVSPCLFVR